MRLWSWSIAGIQGLLETIAKVESTTFRPEPLDYRKEEVKGRLQAPMEQADRAIELAASHCYQHMLREKRHTRQTDENNKPLQAYREEELQQMWRNFFGADQSYHLARKRFVYKGLVPDTALQRAS